MWGFQKFMVNWVFSGPVRIYNECRFSVVFQGVLSDLTSLDRSNGSIETLQSRAKNQKSSQNAQKTKANLK